MEGGSASPEDDGRWIAEGAKYPTAKPHSFTNAFHLWSTTRQLDASARQCRIQLARTLEMFFGQLSHTKILEPAPNHPVEKRVIGRELVGLPFMTIGFVDFA